MAKLRKEAVRLRFEELRKLDWEITEDGNPIVMTAVDDDWTYELTMKKWVPEGSKLLVEEKDWVVVAAADDFIDLTWDPGGNEDLIDVEVKLVGCRQFVASIKRNGYTKATEDFVFSRYKRSARDTAIEWAKDKVNLMRRDGDL